MNKLLIGILCFAFGQTVIWYQTNGQFINSWAKQHPILMSLIFGAPISLAFIIGTKYIVEYFDGALWPGRLIGFGVGSMSFAILTYFYMGEGISAKTAICLILATTIVCIQIFWK